MGDASEEHEGAAAANKEEDRLHASWLEWTHSNLGRHPAHAEAAATAAREAIVAGRGINDAYDAATSKWQSLQVAKRDPSRSALVARDSMSAAGIHRLGDPAALLGLGIGLILVVIWQSATVITMVDHAYWLGPRPCDSACYSIAGLNMYFSAVDLQMNSFWIALPGIGAAVIAKILHARHRRIANIGLVLCIAVPVLIYVGIVFGALAMLA